MMKTGRPARPQGPTKGRYSDDVLAACYRYPVGMDEGQRDQLERAFRHGGARARNGSTLWALLGGCAILAIGAYWLLQRDDPSAVLPPVPETLPAAPEPKPAAAVGSGGVDSDVSTSAFDSDAQVVALSRTQTLVVRQARSLLGDLVPPALAKGALGAEVLARVGERIDADWRRVLTIRSEFQVGAHARAQEVLAAGGYREWEARPIRVPDPDTPGRMVERLSTPYDGQRDDEFILAVAAIESGRRLRHVVRLVPDSDVAYSKLFSEKQRREESVRDELLTWLGTNLR